MFAKLGLSSRTQLAAEAARRRQTTPTASGNRSAVPDVRHLADGSPAGPAEAGTVKRSREGDRPCIKRTTGVIAAAAAAALGIWGIARLLGVDVEVELGGEIRQVGPVDILVATIVAGLAAWVVYSLRGCSRRGRSA